MALQLYTIQDFKGVIKLSGSRFTEEEFDTYFLRYSNEYTNDLLGSDAYNEIVTSDKLKWTKLFEGGIYFMTGEPTETVGFFTGFSDVLKFLIYFHIVRDDFTMTDTGAVSNLNENATKVKQYGIAKDRWNIGADYLKGVYQFIDNMVLDYTGTVTDLGGSFLVEIATDRRTLLEDGEEIEVNEILYPISNHTVVYDVIDPTIIVGETFEVSVDASTFVYCPYSKVVQQPLDYIVL